MLPAGCAIEDFVALAARSWLARQVRDGLVATEGMSASLKPLDTQVRESAVRNAVQRELLDELVQACALHGIPVLLFKGLWLVHCVYRDPAARESGDVDLLFRPEDIARFTQVAGELGFEVPEDGSSLSAQALTSNECALRHPSTGMVVDVHWSLTNPVSEQEVGEPSFWDRSELADIGGVACRTPCLEDHLLYLCFHAAIHHRFWAVGPRCLYDVAMVLRQPPRPIRWDDLLQRAHKLGWARAAWLMLSLVAEHLNVHAPDHVMRVLHTAEPGDHAVCHHALEAIFAAQEQESVYRHLANLAAPQPWSQRLRAARQLLVPSRAQLTNQFGLSPRTPTWLLRARHWTLKVRGTAPELARLLLRRRAQREELARTRHIVAWLGGAG